MYAVKKFNEMGNKCALVYIKWDIKFFKIMIQKKAKFYSSLIVFIEEKKIYNLSKYSISIQRGAINEELLCSFLLPRDVLALIFPSASEEVVAFPGI